MSGRGLTSHVLNRRFPLLTQAHDGLTRRLTDEMRGGSLSKRLVPGRNLKQEQTNCINTILTLKSSDS